MKKTLIFIAVASSLIVGCGAGSSSSSPLVPQTLTLSSENPTCNLSNLDSTVTMTVSGLPNGSSYAYGDLVSNTSSNFEFNGYSEIYDATNNTMTNDVPCFMIAQESGVYPVTAAQILLPSAGGVSNAINITVTGSLLATTSEKLLQHKLHLSSSSAK